jgi:hypothetical protein
MLCKISLRQYMRNWLRNPMHALSMAFQCQNKVYFAKKDNFCGDPSTGIPFSQNRSRVFFFSDHSNLRFLQTAL